ncbi:hypothetical protein HanRHA438_Chr06g0271821 [Helianthus annuus]|nr:hypothetical protein HanIR_Chr06g0282341 [Helianthus annuus]KAJ0912219.1 hypothetical protein HanRHA438_Chr06g0271821 [Helianthus annuus]
MTATAFSKNPRETSSTHLVQLDLKLSQIKSLLMKTTAFSDLAILTMDATGVWKKLGESSNGDKDIFDLHLLVKQGR